MMKIALTNLHQYNEGILNYVWLELPATDEEIEKAFDAIQVSHDDAEYFDNFGCPMEEYFITDYECDFYDVGEYESLETLNELAETLDDLSEDEAEVVEALMKEGYDLEEALEKKDDVIFYPDCYDMEDVAYRIVEESGMLDNIPECVSRYFDYETYARDLDIEGNFIRCGSGYLEVVG